MTVRIVTFDDNVASQAIPTSSTLAGAASRLEVIVVNNSGAALNQYSAYSLEDNAYDLPTNTVTLTATRTGIPTQGQTALFFCQDTIPNGNTGIGVIKGLITTTVLGSTDAERDLKVLASGSLSDIVLAGEYVIGTVTRSPLLDTPLEIAFDGLSNYKLVVAGGGGGHVIENAAGTDLAQRANLQFSGAVVTDDSANDRTLVSISPTGLVIENDGTAIPGQGLVNTLNFSGGNIVANLNPSDNTEISITVSTIASFGTEIAYVSLNGSINNIISSSTVAANESFVSIGINLPLSFERINTNSSGVTFDITANTITFNLAGTYHVTKLENQFINIGLPNLSGMGSRISETVIGVERSSTFIPLKIFSPLSTSNTSAPNVEVTATIDVEVNDILKFGFKSISSASWTTGTSLPAQISGTGAHLVISRIS